MNKPFTFKQFTVQQDRCAMKIGTDGVLLGAWTSLSNNPNSILDIGAGTGLIALQLAQRCQAQTIDAVEINPDAYEQCVENFENSTWNDRLFCYHSSLQEFTEEMQGETYDLIITNPPFYTEAYSPQNNARKTARFQDTLPFNELLVCVSKLLAHNGSFATIIPFKEEEKFIDLALKHALFLNRKWHVKGTETSKIKRSLLQFSNHQSPLEINDLVIEKNRHVYTEAYKNLVNSFYLNM